MRKHRLSCVLLPLVLSVPATWLLGAPAPPGGTPKEVVSFQAHRFHITSLTFSRDGKKLASGGLDRVQPGKSMGKVKIWEVPSGKMLLDIDAHDPAARRSARGDVMGLAYSPDGKSLAYSVFDG
jgi:WD40 repeat protein